jgi:hypothetical protein
VAVALALWVFRELGASPRVYAPAKMLIAAAAIAIVPVVRLLFPESSSLVGGLVAVGAGSIVAGGIYVLALYLLRAVPPNVSAVLGPFARRLRARRAPDR